MAFTPQIYSAPLNQGNQGTAIADAIKAFVKSRNERARRELVERQLAAQDRADAREEALQGYTPDYGAKISEQDITDHLESLNDDQLLRYSRQIMLPYVDIKGQEKLLNARVLIIGMGGLGSPVAMYLAAAGVGHLLICESDLHFIRVSIPFPQSGHHRHLLLVLGPFHAQVGAGWVCKCNFTNLTKLSAT